MSRLLGLLLAFAWMAMVACGGSDSPAASTTPTQPTAIDLGPDSELVQGWEAAVAADQGIPTVTGSPSGDGLLFNNDITYPGYLMSNGWRYTTGDTTFAVFAGATKSYGSGMASLPVILVAHRVPGDFSAGGSAHSPEGVTGSLRILRAEGRVLQLQAADGQELFFDFDTRSFRAMDDTPIEDVFPREPTPGATEPPGS